MRRVWRRIEKNVGAAVFIYPPQADLVQHPNAADARLSVERARLIWTVRRTTNKINKWSSFDTSGSRSTLLG